ncbi:hypothetical protein BDF20DRAFT_602967 [Mycotypha africana]|uniref:uncharacterized protein n=1 Tax=Mycotypha africana TaxID=64632 RepID=UPI002300F14C|nr:uncharacterized protein BDF20DRAFT_602967 [Mycotypha africana]KAI8975383.1 hypothetical protein BDF20DRAFT_602967 [Mycotypha africana]
MRHKIHVETTDNIKSLITKNKSKKKARFYFNSATARTIIALLHKEYVPLLSFYENYHLLKRRKMSIITDQKEQQQQSQQQIKSSLEQSNKQTDSTDSSIYQTEGSTKSVHSFRLLDTTKETDSDKDLIIHSLNESLHIHKEILERIQNEKEQYQLKIEKEREKEQEEFKSWRQKSEQGLEEQNKKCEELEENIQQLQKELEYKKEEYKKLEVNFYSYVKQIRVTDDDLSTIQPEISHLTNQLNNTCMGLKSKMDRQAGTQFVFEQYPDKIDDIKKYMMPPPSAATKEDEQLLETSFITFFVEKYLINILLSNIMDVPIHLGVSINEAFKELNDWMEIRNKEWTNRLRQQVCALVVQQPGEEEEANIKSAKDKLLERIVNVLGPVYPTLKQDPKKIENLITRALKLNLAVKGQEIKIERLPIEEGVTKFDPKTMKATAKGKPNGIVFLSITPTFIARDELDDEHGFTVPGKVFCIEEEQSEQPSETATETNP